jgi:hypothetical protein
MFLQFFIAGAFVPVLSLYLINYLHFSGRQAGIIFSLTSAGSIVAPLFTIYIADRFIPSERLLGLCHGAGGAIMFAFAAQTAFARRAPVIRLYPINAPTFAQLTTAIYYTTWRARTSFFCMRTAGTAIARAVFVGASLDCAHLRANGGVSLLLVGSNAWNGGAVRRDAWS